MFETIGNMFLRKPASNDQPLPPEPRPQSALTNSGNSTKVQTFSKIFRWRLPKGQKQAPTTVEIAGTFTHWEPVPLQHDSAVDGWHLTLHQLPGNRTHRYMMLIDGKPTYDHTCDGLAAPHGPLEERYHIMTEKGPRVMMLFAQTK